MTAGHEGTPESDDPFAYLYRSEGGEQADPAAAQPRPANQPRTSYNQVQRVGERRSPQQPPQATGGYGYPPQQYGNGATQATQQYGQQQYGQQQYGNGATQQYQQQPYGGQQTYEGQPSDGGPGGRRGGHGGDGDGPNRKGLLIGAVAVVAAVAIGIAFAMTNGSGDKGDNAGAGRTTPPVATSAPTTDPTPSATPSDFDSGKVDASTLTLAGGAKQSTQWPGADAANGTYVDGMGAPGASVLWNVTVPEDGAYTFFISYGNAGADANLALAVNAKPRTDMVNLRNYGSYTDWSKAWDNHTYSWVDLKKGANTLSLTCLPTKNCGVNIDQVWLKQGQVKK
ncbi:carbohydrate-binding protein [Actinacidiphila rubida]|uniref:Carbohydrate binding module (Family 6) n=1 Tax=Actinacidiphila rubida TaxID=310780 RepID=A0A1H8DEV1_9ACTN|nr:carbohydrate-binding protein [Actinacidiphila rubida]SEN05802.1 Carbohydrate binding module (family 6) [Actinacidiphila rubida]